MLVMYTKTTTVYVNPRILEEFYEIENVENLTKEEMANLFSEIPISDLVDCCENFTVENEVYKL